MGRHLLMQPRAGTGLRMKSAHGISRARLRADRQPAAPLPVAVKHHRAVGAGLFLGAVEGWPMGSDANVFHHRSHPLAACELVLQAAHLAEQDLAFARSVGS